MPLYIKPAIDVLASPPTCPICKKKMRPYASAGFFECFQTVVDVVCGGDVKFICKGSVPNPKFPAYVARMKEYEQKVQERDKIIMQNQNRLIKKKVPPIPQRPPMATKMIPCQNNYKKICKGGEFNEKIGKRRGGPKYLNVGGVPVEYKII